MRKLFVITSVLLLVCSCERIGSRTIGEQQPRSAEITFNGNVGVEIISVKSGSVENGFKVSAYVTDSEQHIRSVFSNVVASYYNTYYSTGRFWPNDTDYESTGGYSFVAINIPEGRSSSNVPNLYDSNTWSTGRNIAALFDSSVNPTDDYLTAYIDRSNVSYRNRNTLEFRHRKTLFTGITCVAQEGCTIKNVTGTYQYLTLTGSNSIELYTNPDNSATWTYLYLTTPTYSAGVPFSQQTCVYPYRIPFTVSYTITKGKVSQNFTKSGTINLYDGGDSWIYSETYVGQKVGATLTLTGDFPQGADLTVTLTYEPWETSNHNVTL